MGATTRPVRDGFGLAKIDLSATSHQGRLPGISGLALVHRALETPEQAHFIRRASFAPTVTYRPMAQSLVVKSTLYFKV